MICPRIHDSPEQTQRTRQRPGPYAAGRWRTVRWIAFVLCGLSAHLSVAVAQSTDAVVVKDGSPIRGEVVSATRTEVTVQGEDGKRIIPAYAIKYILFAGEPSSMRRVRVAAGSGQADKAKRTLDRLDESQFERLLAKADLQFYRALVNQQLALESAQGMASAAANLLRFVKENPDSHHFYEAAEALGDLALAMQRYPDAARFYGSLEKSPWPGLRLQGAILMADTLHSQGGDQLPEALKRYEVIIATHAEEEDAVRQQQVAAARRASCLAELGKPEEGKAALRSLIAEAKPTDSELLAVSYNALGDCHRVSGQAKDALLAYLHTELLFADQREMRAEALYQIAKLWAQLGDDDRSAEARQMLDQEFAASRWATIP